MNHDHDSLSAVLARYTACPSTSHYQGRWEDACRLADEVKGLVEACRALLKDTDDRGRGGGDVLHLSRAIAIAALQKFEATP